jgi:hypothetical protein
VGPGRVTLITCPEDPTAPRTLAEPCVIGTYEEDDDDGAAVPFPSVLLALRDLYGIEEGTPDYPLYLRPGAAA